VVSKIEPLYTPCDFCHTMRLRGKIPHDAVQLAVVEVRSPEAFQFLSMCRSHFQKFAEEVRAIAIK